MTIMPGGPYVGPDPDGFMTGRDFVDLLDDFVSRHALPVETDCPVLDLSRDAAAGCYQVDTPQQTILTNNVVIASGCQNDPRLPRQLAASMPQDLMQLHVGDYRTAAALPDGAVLVIGSATSGVQITDDLLQAGRTVYLATSRVARMPRRHRGRDVIMWRLESGFLDEPPGAQPDPSLRFQAQPQMAAGKTISLQWLASRGAILLGHLAEVNGARLSFADDLEANVRFADETSARTRRSVDEYISGMGIDAPSAEPDPGEAAALQVADPPFRMLDLARARITSVVWCTGFAADYGWVRLPVFDASGDPMHDEGATAFPGIYFIGLPWLSCRRSMLIAGVDRDAGRIAGWVAERCRNPAS
jgi:putative flavoprotein involved in K+ transport